MTRTLGDSALDDVRSALEEFRNDPTRATVASGEVADQLDIEQAKATKILHQLENRGEVRRWSGKNSPNPKWVVGGAT